MNPSLVLATTLPGLQQIESIKIFKAVKLNYVVTRVQGDWRHGGGFFLRTNAAARYSQKVN
jgi:hypothetical protein